MIEAEALLLTISHRVRNEVGRVPREVVKKAQPDYFGPTSRPRRYLFTPPRCMVGLELCCTRPARYPRSSRCGHREVGGVIPLQPWGLTAQ